MDFKVSQTPQNSLTLPSSYLCYPEPASNRLIINDHRDLSIQMLQQIKEHASRQGIGKIISKCRNDHLDLFLENGFVQEGKITSYFAGEDAYCVSCFLQSSRAFPRHADKQDKILSQCRVMAEMKRTAEKTGCEFIIRNASTRDIPQMIKIFRQNFASYPSPVFDAKYLSKTMQGKIMYKLALADTQIVSIASADMNHMYQNAEITDCVTIPQWRGKGCLSALIGELEEDLRRWDFLTAYSLARAGNPGINLSLSSNGYCYEGRLINNCNICGNYEDMNIWTKCLLD
ncbi:putative beta-lysine N-acetyltransferase [Syntrophomonas palmitatica]|uniref:putative beta-lysine N-acetyltransferase n=1 Tax=Syntrophomonas palmitatica TaxID=402877 RepID=UPI0006D24212|nr:putative beta-lysine N-acetyltransferase [Syntrophomonas palmitatica]